MHRAFRVLLAAVFVALPVWASSQQPGPTALHIVSYVEVGPGMERTAGGLLRQHRDASRREQGSLRMDVLQQSGRPSHFVVLETWQDKDAWAAHSAMAHTKQLAADLAPQLASPVDQRQFNSLAIAAGSAGDDAVYVVSHVDMIFPQTPSAQNDPVGILKSLAEASRKDEGNLRFDVWQSDRRNHFTVVEAWRNQRALDAHTTAPHTKQYRDQLQPLAGSPLDERVFTVLK